MLNNKFLANFRHGSNNKLKKTTALLIVLSLVGLLSLTGCGSQAATAGGAGKTEIKVGQAGPQTVEGNVTLSGVIDSGSNVTVTSQLSGKVTAINFKEGSRVNKGDVLVTLDQADLRSQLQQAELGLQKAQAAVELAKISYDNAQDTFTRNQQLFKANGISQAQMDQITTARDLAKSQYDAAENVGLPTAQAAVDAVQLNIAKATIVSPMGGVVATCPINVGDNIIGDSLTPGTPLATIVSVGDPVLTGNISESVLNQVTLGQKVEVKADSIPGVKFEGTISFVSPVSVTTGQFFPAKITVQDPKAQLKPGMTGNATIHVTEQGVVALPNSALFRRNGRDYVYVIKEGKAVMTHVQFGFQGDKYSSITEGIAAGDSVVIQGADQLVDGMKIPEK